MVVFWFLISCVLVVTHAETADEIYERQKDNQWFQDGVNLIKDNLQIRNINKKAKGIILFIGDGMGISTVTAGRILDGQLQDMTGEENILNWENHRNFPNVGLSKTYNTNMQVADSAGTATAFMTGVKSRTGVISVDENVTRGDCSSSQGRQVLSIIMLAEQYGLSTGVVTTASLTHATPSTAYAHAADRNWESDFYMKGGSQCKDIASQLIDFPYGDGLEVALGGGRKYFLPNTVKDFETQQYGTRRDGRHLINEWMNKSNTHHYVRDQKGFDNLNVDHATHILGLFNYKHMEYAYNRVNDTAGEPSLTEMVELAIKKLQQNEKGYVLLVESGRIDHGHHANKAFHALHDTVELNRAVGKAVNMTDPEETLLIVTADHSHVFTLGGYQKRGTDIFGFTNQKTDKGRDGKKFTTLGYFNGPGAAVNTVRSEPKSEELSDPGHAWQSLVPLYSETHGGEDVGIYARGAQAHLIRGVVEQNYIFHVMDYALCLSESKKDICRSQGLLQRRSSTENSIKVNLHLVVMTWMVFIYINIF